MAPYDTGSLFGLTKATYDLIGTLQQASKDDTASAEKLTTALKQASKNGVDSTDKLITALNQASRDSSRMAGKIAFLTICLVMVALLQVVVMAWPYLAWWWDHRG